MKIADTWLIKKLYIFACALLVISTCHANTVYPLKVKGENGEVTINDLLKGEK